MAGESARDVARRAREKAARLEQRAQSFEKGAEGEAATAAVLASLPPEWTTIHDVRWPRRRLANIDHLVVGPGGIFVIDTKNWSGRVSMDRGVLRQNGRSREQAVAGGADAALAIAELAGPHAAQVFPVLCFVDQPQVSGWVRDVMVCSTANLLEMLVTRPQVMTPDHIADASLRLDAQLRAAVSQAAPSSSQPTRPTPTTPLVGPSRKHITRHGAPQGSRRTLKRKRSVARPLLGIGMIIAMLTAGPEIAGEVGEIIAEYLTEDLRTPAHCDPNSSSQPSGTDC